MKKLSPFTRRLLSRLLVCLVIVYAFFGAYVWWAMHQPPEAFGRVMARMPGPVVFMLFPFETCGRKPAQAVCTWAIRATFLCSSWTRASAFSLLRSISDNLSCWYSAVILDRHSGGRFPL